MSKPLEYLHYATLQRGDKGILFEKSGVFGPDWEERKNCEHWHLDLVCIIGASEIGNIKLHRTYPRYLTL